MSFRPELSCPRSGDGYYRWSQPGHNWCGFRDRQDPRGAARRAALGAGLEWAAPAAGEGAILCTPGDHRPHRTDG